LLVSEAEQGICRVICFSPRHDLTLPELDLPAIENVIATWTEQSANLGTHDFIHYVQVFENKGEVMGASNPHPHSQVWASGHIPNEPGKELAAQIAYFNQYQRPLLADILAEEHKRKERILASNDHFTALVPFWAIWPFEILLSAHRPTLTRLTEMTSAEATALAEILKAVTTRYDNLFEISFPYSMGFHQAPFDGERHPVWMLHAHFYPPLLRSATVRKFMVGYEMLAMPQRDITPETAAERLRSLPEIHYKQRSTNNSS
jgi:UDPglucose--hexose-1-phosphate uridylyltransferase